MLTGRDKALPEHSDEVQIHRLKWCGICSKQRVIRCESERVAAAVRVCSTHVELVKAEVWIELGANVGFRLILFLLNK